jgi:hypothetical protein
MDFEKIDDVAADDLGRGDIVQNDQGEFLQIRSVGLDETDIITYDAYNLSTGDEDSFMADPALSVPLFRSY